MTTDAQKTALISDLDASPAVRETVGRGAAGAVLYVSGTIVPANGGVNSTYTVARLPSNAKLKKILFASASQGATGIFEIGAWYACDGSSIAKSLASHIHSGTDAISEGFFGSSLSAASQAVYAELIPGGGFSIEGATPAILTNASWTLALATGNEELWNVLGLTSDPHCNIDIVVENTAALATPVGFYSRVEYVI